MYYVLLLNHFPIKKDEDGWIDPDFFALTLTHHQERNVTHTKGEEREEEKKKRTTS
jgi:hypothetical protein